MKPDIHPKYREVVFQDMTDGSRFMTRSTVESRETTTWDDGKEYPLIKLEVTAESHPFYTGAQQQVRETGQVEKFRQKFGRKGGKAKAAAAAEPEKKAD